MDNGHDNNAPQPDAQQPLETPAQPDASQSPAPQPNVPQAGTEQPASQVNADQPAAPQGIFSSGDLAVHSENLDAIKPELSDENKSRIASAFAQTDATQKHDQLADQMADQDAISGTVLPAGSFSNATASSASGDIRLPGRKKKSKLPLLVLAAVVVLAVVAGGVWWVMRNNGGDSGQPTTALSATEEAFAKYANYLLYGEEKTTLEGEYSEDQSYVVDQQLESKSYSQDYWDKSETLLKTALANLRQSNSPDKDSLINIIDNYQVYFDFLKTYKRVGDIDDEALLQAYIANDMDGVEILLNNRYSAFYSLDSELATAYADQRKEQYRSVAGVYSIYRELGCIIEGALNEEVCRAANPSLEVQERLAELSAEIAHSARQADTTIENASRYLASYCWDFYDFLKNPNKLKGDFDE